MTEARSNVVITGVGLVTPFGTDKEQIAHALANGKSGLRWLSDEPPAKNRGLQAGAPAVYESKFGHDPVVEMAMQASESAVQDAAIDLGVLDSNRIGCVIGTSKGLLDTYADDFQNEQQLTIGYPGFQPNAPARYVASHLGCHGPCLCPIAACATGLASLARGVQLIDDGHSDVVLAGSSDASLGDWVLNSFNRLGVLAKNFNDPAEAVRPFADDREGFLVGEGAAVFVLETQAHARARQARVRATWLGSSSGSDPTGMTQIDESGQNFAPVIQACLNNANVRSEDVDLLNLHGTATWPNDLCETNAVDSVFDSRAINRRAYKALIGHCLGAAGSIEVALSLIERGWTTQLKTSLGFGGHALAAVLQANS